MPTRLKRHGSVIQVIHEPGNGTKYEALGVKMPVGLPDRGDAWLITFPQNGTSHFFREGSFVAVSYVAEKLAYQSNGAKVSEVDLNEMAKCITTITGGWNDAKTTTQGSISPLRIAP